MNFIIRKIFAIVLILGISTSTTQAIIQSCALFSIQRQNVIKNVLVLGDYHGSMAPIDSPYNLANERDFGILLEFIKKLFQCHVKTKILLETSKEELNYINSLHNKAHLGLLHKIPLFAKNNNYILDRISFSLADLRTGPIGNLHTFFAYISSTSSQSMIFNPLNKDFIRKMLGGDPSLQDVFKQTTHLVHELKSELKLIGSGRLTNFVQKLLTTIKNCKNLGEQSFSEKEKQLSFTDLFTFMISTQKISNFFDHGKTWIDPMCCSIMDAGLLIELAKSIRKYNQIIVLVGHAHALVVQDFLTQFGFTACYNVGLNHNYDTPFLFHETDLEYLLNRFLPRFDSAWH